MRFDQSFAELFSSMNIEDRDSLDTRQSKDSNAKKLNSLLFHGGLANSSLLVKKPSPQNVSSHRR